jgi:hypothetical protein
MYQGVPIIMLKTSDWKHSRISMLEVEAVTSRNEVAVIVKIMD